MNYFGLIFLFFVTSCFSQSPKLSGPEFTWALGHPLAAIKVKCITKRCQTFLKNSASDTTLQPAGTKVRVLDNYSNGGKEDAFRHCFYMAAYAQKIKTKKLRKLGRAHEKANYRSFLKARQEDGELPDSLGSVMDLQNNELGMSIGSTHKKASLLELQQVVVLEIRSGKALIMKRDAFGNYLDCEGKKIDIKAFPKIWYIPKCLVTSE